MEMSSQARVDKFGISQLLARAGLNMISLTNHFISIFDFKFFYFLFSLERASNTFFPFFSFFHHFPELDKMVARMVDRCIGCFISSPHAIHWTECSFSFRGIADTTAHRLNGISNSCTGWSATSKNSFETCSRKIWKRWISRPLFRLARYSK